MRRGPAVASLGTALIVVAGCAGGGSSSPVPASPMPATPPTSPSAITPPAVVATPPVTTPADAPPDASLAVDGGDPVTGQLGTFIWQESGSDAPWLPGTPIAVGVAETLVMAFDPSVAIADWSARYAPAGTVGADGTMSLGGGTGPPTLAAPPAGRWTVAVTVTFADGLGEATYYWAVEAR